LATIGITPYAQVVEIVEGVKRIAANSGEAPRKLLESAAALIAYQAGQLAAVDKRLDGDMSEIPDSALVALVNEHARAMFDEGGLYSDTAKTHMLKLAVDVRLLCFFRSLAEHSDED
jgi:hypothetical protein